MSQLNSNLSDLSSAKSESVKSMTGVNKKMLIIVIISLIIIIIILLLALIAFIINRNNLNQTESNTNSLNLPESIAIDNPSSNPIPTIVPTTTPSSNYSPVNPPITNNPVVYDNQYINLIIPAGWTYTTTKMGDINLFKDNYILYINPNLHQTSGVQGGRFGEIALGAPSSDAVIKTQPSEPCMIPETNTSYGKFLRQDLYVNKSNSSDNCNAAASGSTNWYFSYFNQGMGYINYYSTKPDTGWVITLAYNSTNVNNLPVKNSPTLTSIFNQVTNILGTLKLKQK